MHRKKILLIALVVIISVSTTACVRKLNKNEEVTSAKQKIVKDSNDGEEKTVDENSDDGKTQLEDNVSKTEAKGALKDTKTSDKPNKKPETASKPANTSNSSNKQQTTGTKLRKQSELQNSLYKYLSNQANQNSVQSASKKLNGGTQTNTCVYFVSEALRRIGSKVPLGTANTKQFISYLKSNGWKVSYNLSELQPGDLCFTTNDVTGWPSHVYTFMSWVKSGSTDYAYIVDNQANDYNGNAYHQRNVKKKIADKDATVFFMYKPT